MSKSILITGNNSYIGTSFEKWMAKYEELYIIDKVSCRDNEWKDMNFSKYDVIFHVAGIAHVDTPKKNSTNYDVVKQLYYAVNRDITIDVAKKARDEGVGQFIFMSSIIVYGESSSIGEKKVITRETVPFPSNFYGDSKLQAEKAILALETNNFQIIIIRAPMVYGKGSKGNYPKLSKLARIFPLFPNIENERSMIHIDNLCEFVRLLIDNSDNGIFYPQNKEYVQTTELVKLIAEIHGKRLTTVTLFNSLIILLGKKISLINKVFGNLVYDKHLSDYHSNSYCIRDLNQSIELTEDY